jgi:hypothetical protein
MEINDKVIHPRKVSSGRAVNCEPSVAAVSAAQPAKQPASTTVNDEGRMIEPREMQPVKAEVPIDSSAFERVIEVSDEQRERAKASSE